METTASTMPMPPPVPAEVGKLYDRYTDLGADSLGDNLHFGYWDPTDADLDFAEATDRLTDLMTDQLQLRPGDHLLDLGCGVGTPGVRTALRHDVRVTGISVSAAQIQRANALAARRGVADRVHFELRDAMQAGFEPESFDAVLALESIIHMPDRGAVLAMVSRALKPGGRLVLTDFFERSAIPEPGRSAVDRYLREFMMTDVDLAEYPRLARSAGLWLELIRDLSDFTLRRTFVELSARLRGSYQSLSDAHGTDLVEAFDPGDLIEVPEFGYVLVTLRKPPR
jgi:O-methyltransferase StaMB